MKQVLQSLKTGNTEVAEVPAPGTRRGSLTIRTTRTLISAGTERMLVDFGKANFVEKALRQPDKVRQVIAKIRTDGLLPTIEAVFNKLDQPLPLGYCNVGVVDAIGEGVTAFAAGTRVVSNGKHAEFVTVPQNLCAAVPDRVTDDQAAFTVLGAIALQGVRLAQPTLGEAVAVSGLGLVGLLTVQLLRANGCRVLGIDFDPARLALARQFGAETVDLSAGQDPVGAAMAFSRGRGMDAVLVAASTKSSEPMHQAALMSRQRGRVVLVGVTGLDLVRDDFYKKEISLQVSSSYGPGRYDSNYEEKGQDYPVGFVRWTAQRNFEAVMDVMADGRLDVGPLVSHRFPIAEAAKAYDEITGSNASLGILLEYPVTREAPSRRVILDSSRSSPRQGTAGISFVGAGDYAAGVLIPAFANAGASLRLVTSADGVSALHAGRKFGFAEAVTDTKAVIADATTDAVVIATRHDSHARLTCDALEAGKSVFVEKPLCLSADELARVEEAYSKASVSAKPARLMIGFNRRFAPHVVKMKSLLAAASGLKVFAMTINTGAIPREHWTRDAMIGGGRIVGEACHFIDLLRFLAGAPIASHHVTRVGDADSDAAIIDLTFTDGTTGTIQYLTNGSKTFPKERVEVFASGGVLQLDNYRKLRGFGWPGFRSMSLWRQDKGQRACAAAFVSSILSGAPAPIPAEEIFEVSRVTLAVGAQHMRGA